MPKQGILEGSTMMPPVFKKTAHVEDLYWQLTRFQSEVNM